MVCHFRVVILGKLAKIGPAKRFVLQAHFAFGRKGHGFDGCAFFLKAFNGVLGDGMLTVFGSDIKKLLAPLESVFQQRQNQLLGCGLATAGSLLRQGRFRD